MSIPTKDEMMEGVMGRPPAKEQVLLNRRYEAICALDSFLSELPMTDTECNTIAEFWSAHFPNFMPLSGNTGTQKLKPSA